MPTRLALVLVLALHAGCEAGVDPFAETGRHYSIFGYLDAAADTQWVRVRPLQAPIRLPAAPLDAVVTLEDVATGRAAVLRDSLLHFPEGPAHLLWTTAPVAHGRTYRLRVAGPGGASSATVTLPPAFPAPVGVLQPSIAVPAKQFTYVIRIAAAPRVADVQLIFRLRGAASDVYSLSLRDRVAGPPGAFEVTFIPYDLFYSDHRAAACPAIESASVRVAATAADWPDLAALDDETLVLPDVANNIVHGVGFFGAVSSRETALPDLAAHLSGLRDLCLRCAAQPWEGGCR